MRLTQECKTAIKAILTKHFGAGSSFYLFGSRVDDNKKGGDIDLYIKTDLHQHEQAISLRNKAIADLILTLGDQKFDIVIHTKNTPILPIHKIALQTGIKI